MTDMLDSIMRQMEGPPGFTCWISFALVLSFIYC